MTLDLEPTRYYSQTRADRDREAIADSAIAIWNGSGHQIATEAARALRSKLRGRVWVAPCDGCRDQPLRDVASPVAADRVWLIAPKSRETPILSVFLCYDVLAGGTPATNTVKTGIRFIREL